MGHYYFDLRDKRGLFPDEEGSECVDLDAVQDEAARSLADLAWDVVHSTHASPIIRRQSKSEMTMGRS